MPSAPWMQRRVSTRWPVPGTARPQDWRNNVSGRLRTCDRDRRCLTEGWEVAKASAPDVRWSQASVPGTVAGHLRDTGAWNLDATPRLDAEEWWYRIRF